MTWLAWRQFRVNAALATVAGVIIVGVGGGRRKWHHVHWEVVRAMGIAWLFTMPAAAALAAFALGLWRLIA